MVGSNIINFLSVPGYGWTIAPLLLQAKSNGDIGVAGLAGLLPFLIPVFRQKAFAGQMVRDLACTPICGGPCFPNHK